MYSPRAERSYKSHPSGSVGHEKPPRRQIQIARSRIALSRRHVSIPDGLPYEVLPWVAVHQRLSPPPRADLVVDDSVSVALMRSLTGRVPFLGYLIVYGGSMGATK